MTDELDLLTRARDRLIELDRQAVDGPWEVEFRVPKMSGESWVMRTRGAPGICAQVNEYQRGPHTAELIVALRGCAPYLIDSLDGAIEMWDQPLEHRVLHAISGNELSLARAILGETEGQNNEH